MEFNGKMVVLKEYNFTITTARRQFLRSVRLMHQLTHPNIAVVEATFEDEDEAKGFVQMPLYIGGPLLFWLHRPENIGTTHGNTGIVQRTSEKGMLCYVRSLFQILTALAHVHSHDAVHGDLKLDNALVDQNGNIKLADFDLSREAEDKTNETKKSAVHAMMTTRAGGGTVLYMSPEVQRKERATSASDIYAYGICVLQAFVPNAQLTTNPTTLVRLIPNEIKRYEPELHSLLEVTLRENPKDRMTASDLLQHEFFKVDSIIKELAERKVKEKKAMDELEQKKIQGRRTCSCCFVEDTRGERKDNPGERKEEKHEENKEIDPAVEAAIAFLQKDNNDKRCRKHLCDNGLKRGKTFAVVNKAKTEIKRRQNGGQQNVTTERIAGVFDVSEGVECHAQDRHFMCEDCLSIHVKTSVEVGNLPAFEVNKCNILCVVTQCGQKISDHSIATHTSADRFGEYFAARSAIKERQLAEELEKGVEQRIELRVAAIAALSDAEKRLRSHRKHVIERILTLACPRCSRAFIGFEGCFALKCSAWVRGQENSCCQFCAYCLKDCGRDAHAHVREMNCPGNQGLFKSVEVFEATQLARRERLVKEYLAGIENEDEKMELVVNLSTELIDLGLDPQKLL